MLARGEPFLVHPSELAKSTAAYQTDPEILLGCMIVSGSLDTAVILRTEILLGNGLKVTEEARASFDAFRRVWSQPTTSEREAVMSWAKRLAGGGDRTFRWSKPT